MSSISGITPTPGASQAGMAQILQNFEAIGSALQSGNLSGAKSAFTSFQQALQGATQSSATQPAGQNSQMSTDFQTLLSDLQSGDMAGAQKALATLQTDLKSMLATQASNSASTSAAGSPVMNSSNGISIGGLNLTA